MPNLEYSPSSQGPTLRWNAISADGQIPVARWGHTCTAVNKVGDHSPNPSLFVFGGGGPGRVFDDYFLLDAERNNWSIPETSGAPPGDRAGHAAVLTEDNCLLIFGGSAGPQALLNDLFVLDMDALEWWAPETQGELPSKRVGHTATLAGNKMIVFGGCEESDVWTDNKVYVLNIETWTWFVPEVRGEVPSPRSAHSATVVNGNKMIVYGGIDGKQRLDDLYVLDTDTWTWQCPFTTGVVPPGRSSHTATLVRDKLAIYGGWCMDDDGDRCVDDLYLLDVASFRWSRPTLAGSNTPKPRANHTAAAIGSKLFVYGGRDGLKQVDGRQACFRDLHVVDINGPSNNASPTSEVAHNEELQLIMGIKAAPRKIEVPSDSGGKSDEDDGGNMTPSGKNPRKRHRTTPEQLEILERSFKNDHMPNEQARFQIASQIGMSPRSVQIWFQNKRAKVKRAERDGTPGGISGAARMGDTPRSNATTPNTTPNHTPNVSPSVSPTPEQSTTEVPAGPTQFMSRVDGSMLKPSAKNSSPSGSDKGKRKRSKQDTREFKPSAKKVKDESRMGPTSDKVLPADKKDKLQNFHPAESEAIFSLMALASNASSSTVQVS
eukprot:GFYU01001925.1.p1 GENE.GFYU01001925.1~~GFYU01001925.1.p1  ORF type:complete len:604 (-),score=184.61 GFYU01001925.1:301-2112(-)